MASASSPIPTPVNVVVLCGVLSRPAEVRTLPSGDRLATLQVTVLRTDGPADTVPVVVADPSTTVSSLDTGAEVVITGRIRRRFFQAGGRTASATELVADAVHPTNQRRRIQAAVERAGEALSAALIP